MPSFAGETSFSHVISPDSVDRSWLDMKGKLNSPVCCAQIQMSKLARSGFWPNLFSGGNPGA